MSSPSVSLPSPGEFLFVLAFVLFGDVCSFSGQAVMCLSIGAVECLQFFSSTNGSLTKKWCTPELVIDNVGFDTIANVLYFGNVEME